MPHIRHVAGTWCASWAAAISCLRKVSLLVRPMACIRDYAFRMNVTEEIFEIRSCIETLANDIKVDTTDQYMLYSQCLKWLKKVAGSPLPSPPLLSPLLPSFPPFPSLFLFPSLPSLPSLSPPLRSRTP